jgi:hypothetical protein
LGLPVDTGNFSRRRIVFLLGNALVAGTALLVFAILLLGIPAYWSGKPFAVDKFTIAKKIELT